MNSKRIRSLLMALALAASVAGAQEQKPALQSEKEIRSYALGMDLGTQLRKLSIEVDPALFAKGLGDALAGAKLLLTEADARSAIGRMQVEAKARQLQKGAPVDPKAADENRKNGETFLAENAKRPGVVTLPSGLQYKVMTQGTGKKPTASDTVVCQYRGTLIDGTEFDSSYSRGAPASFPVSGVIAGWTEALQLMPVGSKWQLFIPPSLAYGARGAGDKIGPNATLVFEIELLSVK